MAFMSITVARALDFSKIQSDSIDWAKSECLMDVHVRLTRRGDLSMQIYRQLLEAVLDGRIRPERAAADA